jgi:23S rRNA (cytidine2498-2'-O)-methyltransferase
MNTLLVKPGAELFAIEELTYNSIKGMQIDDGVIAFESPITSDSHLTFPYWLISDLCELKYETFNKLYSQTVNWFCEQLHNEQINQSWPLLWLVPSDNGHTADPSKAHQFQLLLKKKMSRIAKLATTDNPDSTNSLTGLFIIELKNKKVLISRTATYFGQRRMRDDAEAPSRSFLKIEEALSIFKAVPGYNETVVDLGAAPGGWTWAAAKRGADVFAIDNGPLKKGPLNHPNVHHIRSDAFTWHPANPVDWLFCDIVDQPMKVLNLVKTWFANRWCKYAIVNFKYGYSNPNKVINHLYSKDGLAGYCKYFKLIHLFHDREEITMLAEIE